LLPGGFEARQDRTAEEEAAIRDFARSVRIATNFSRVVDPTGNAGATSLLGYLCAYGALNTEFRDSTSG
jgi:hypothetical protein